MHNRENEITEVQLMTRLTAGDQAVVSLIYDKYGAALYGVCMKILKGDTGRAQDVLQESIVKIWKYGQTFDPKKGSLFTWMLNITRNTAIDHLRKFSKQNEIQKDISNVHTNTQQLSTSKNVDLLDIPEKVDSLDDNLKEVIELAYFQGMTHQQISQSLGMPLGTVKTRIKNGINKLRKIYIRS